jgi:hypothetical protein
LLGFASLYPTYEAVPCSWVSLRSTQPTKLSPVVGFRFALPNLRNFYRWGTGGEVLHNRPLLGNGHGAFHAGVVMDAILFKTSHLPFTKHGFGNGEFHPGSALIGHGNHEAGGRVRQHREERVDKTLAAVLERLTKEINYWDQRAAQLHRDEKTGKTHARSSGS